MSAVDILDDSQAVAMLLDALDLPVIDDAVDPFADLAPMWRRFAVHIMAAFDPADLPLILRPLAPAATGMLAKRLASDPEGSRLVSLELIEMAVRDLQLHRLELSCWDADGTALPPCE